MKETRRITRTSRSTAAVHASVLSRVSGFDRGVRHARFKVLRHIRIPARLLEAGFLNDPAEGQRIATPQYRQQLGHAIAQGVHNYNAAVNYRAPATRPSRVVRANLPPHARSITEPLAMSDSDMRRARRNSRRSPSVAANDSRHTRNQRGDSRPIGVFDSGIGGLTVVSALRGSSA